jgi:hypothetical protein
MPQTASSCGTRPAPSGICEGAGFVKCVQARVVVAVRWAVVRHWCCVGSAPGCRAERCSSAARHLSAPTGAWCGRATTRNDSISSSTSPPGWESCRFRVAWGRVRASRGGPLLEAADLAVAQAVVDEGHQPARGSRCAPCSSRVVRRCDGSARVTVHLRGSGRSLPRRPNAPASNLVS